jgi:serine/threonine protein phosphatase PrpC
MVETRPAWEAIGSVVTGANHIRQEKPCQDALFLRHGRKPAFEIACVADGHGSSSCPHSDLGAQAAVHVASEILTEMLPNIAAHKDIKLPRLIESTWKEYIEKIHSSEESFSHMLYGTTLIAVAATDDFIFALQIGDGNILMVDKENARPILAVEENVGEDTESLCLEDAWTYIRTQIIPWNAKNPAMLLLTTDGYANSFSDSAGFLKAGTDFFKLWQEEGLEYIKENLPEWLRNTSDKGSGDDIAMALMVFEGGE